MSFFYSTYTTKNVVCVIAADGTPLPIDSLAQTLNYTNGVLQTTQVTYNGTTYTQTYTYTSGNLTGVSQWQ